jgi:PAS domain S-box-containing protein
MAGVSGAIDWPRSEDEGLRRSERAVVTVRWIAALWGLVQVVSRSQPPYPPGIEAMALGIMAVLVAGNAMIWLATRRGRPLAPRVPLLGLALDAAVASAMVWAYTFDNVSALWAILVIVALEAATRFGRPLALATWGAMAASYALREVWGSAHYGYVFEWQSITFRMGIVLIAGLMAGGIANELRRQRSVAEDARTRYAGLVDGLDAIVWECDPGTYRFSYVNRRAEEILGYPVDQWLSEADFWEAHLHPGDRARVVAECATATAEGRDHELEYRMIGADGRVVWLRDGIRVERDPSGRPVLLRGVMVDVSERASAAAALHASEARAQAVFDAGAIGMALLDLDGRYLQVNRRLCEITGYDEARLVGSSFWDITHADDLARGRNIVDGLLARPGVPVQSEKRYLRPDGSVVWVVLATAAVADQDGRAAFIVSQVLDVTEARRAEAVRREAEERFRVAFQNSPIGMALVSPEGRWLRVNQSLCDMVGYSEAELLTKGFSDLTHPDDLGPHLLNHRRMLSGGTDSDRTDKRYIHASGRVVWVHLEKVLVRDPEGRPLYFVSQIQDITERREAEEALRESELQFRSLTEVAPDAIVVMDGEGRIVSWNHGATEMFGYQPEEVLGHPVSMLMPKRFRSAHEAGLARLRGGGKPSLIGSRVELVGQREDGTEFPIELSLATWQTRRGAFYSGIIRDMTGYKQAEQALAAARDEAMEASRLKSEFLATVSHEIRTPMNAIIGMSGLLLETELDAKQRNCAETVASSADALLTIINHILDFSKADAGKLELESAPFDVRALVDESLAVLSESARSKGLELTVVTDPSVPLVCLGDRGRLRQVLFNLLSNAVKFTEEGSVGLRVGTTQAAQDWMLEFEITDTGIGIDPDQVAHLFEPFWQADASTTRRYGGTGLGLSICKQLVAMMGGYIGVEGLPGQGSRFWFAIPLQRVTEDTTRGPATAKPADPTEARSSRGRVLVVEDNLANQEVARLMLDHLGYEAHVAGGGQEALEALSLEPFSAILMDCHLPGMDGYEVTARIRAAEAAGETSAARIPIIAMTGAAMPGDRERCLTAGMDGYLSKPVRIDELARKLDRWAPQPALGEAGPAIDLEHFGFIRRMCAGQEGTRSLDHLLGIFFDEAERRIQGLEEAVRAGESDTVMELGHGLKGSSGTFGAVAVSSLASLLEEAGRQGELEGADLVIPLLRVELERARVSFRAAAVAQ